MQQDIVFASVRLGEISASEGWKLLAPIVDTEDPVVAARLFDALRAWTWKALDRRRRDDSLREWIDLLNRVEGFLADRFDRLAAKIEVLSELLHESIAVADLAEPEVLLRRKHVPLILMALAYGEAQWIDRAKLMQKLGLRSANTTRLMSLLVDIGWVEQEKVGREASYRISSEGLMHVPAAGPTYAAASKIFKSDHTRLEVISSYADALYRAPNQQKIHRRGSCNLWDKEVSGIFRSIETDTNAVDEDQFWCYSNAPLHSTLCSERTPV